MKQKLIFTILFAGICMSLHAQYIHDVPEYKPAPGQLINSGPWGIPQAAQSIKGTVNGSMTLGTFGGYVIFSFESPVENHPDNPYGVDFTIFGNPTPLFSETGIVSVMKDDNNNGIPDDTWYELAGSDYFFGSTQKNYSVTYSNPNQASAADVPWTDSDGNTGYILSNAFHSQPYYPLHDSFPAIPEAEYTLSGTKIPDLLDKTISTNIKSYPRAFGYADNLIRGNTDTNLPDNPYTEECENSGGDAFDISWAVNENGEYVNLDQIDFIRVHNAVLADAGWMGEISTEITGAVDVAPDNSQTGITDRIVIRHLPDTIKGTSCQLEVAAFTNKRFNPETLIAWESSRTDALISEEGMLTFSESGEVTITAKLSDNPGINTSVTCYLQYDENQQSNAINEIADISVYPNPAHDVLYIDSKSVESLEIFDITGVRILTTGITSSPQAVSVAELPQGMYLIRMKGPGGEFITRFQKL